MIIDLIKRFILYRHNEEKQAFVLEKNESPVYDIRTEEPPQKNEKIFFSIEDNRKYMEKRFSAEKNDDFIIRDISLCGDTKCFLAFYDGMCSGEKINEGIIKPLLELPLLNGKRKKYDLDTIYQKLLVHNQIKTVKTFDELADGINFGCCGIFVDGIDSAFCADVKDWPHRSVETAKNEQSIYGPQDAFADMLRGSSAQVRKILKTEKLICEKISAGDVSKTPGIIMYLDGVANRSLIHEIRRRINGISVELLSVYF